MARLKEHYKENVIKQLKEQFGYKSVMEVPRITKITENGVTAKLLRMGCKM